VTVGDTNWEVPADDVVDAVIDRAEVATGTDGVVLGAGPVLVEGCAALWCDPLLHAESSASARVTVPALVFAPCKRILAVCRRQ